MENLILFGLVMFILYLIAKSGDQDAQVEIVDDNRPLPGDRFKQKEKMFYHPVTGYKGTRSEMDAYIVNRENERR